MDSNNNIYVSRHVLFDESIFPYPTLFLKSNSLSPQSSVSIPAPSLLHKITQSNNHSISYTDLSQPSNNSIQSISSDQPGSNSSSSVQHLDPIHAQQNDQDSNLGTISVSHMYNQHSMITRAKHGIFKHKVYTASLDECEPVSIEQALTHDKWRAAVQAEYDALMKN